MESHNMRAARASVEIRNMLTTRRLPLRAWKLWKTLRGADPTTLRVFFEKDDHHFHLRNYFFSGPSFLVSGGRWRVSELDRVQHGRNERPMRKEQKHLDKADRQQRAA